MVIKGGKTCPPPKIGQQIQIKLPHDDDTYCWYRGEVVSTRDEEGFSVYKVKFEKEEGDERSLIKWVNLTSQALANRNSKMSIYAWKHVDMEN